MAETRSDNYEFSFGTARVWRGEQGVASPIYKHPGTGALGAYMTAEWFETRRLYHIRNVLVLPGAQDSSEKIAIELLQFAREEAGVLGAQQVASRITSPAEYAVFAAVFGEDSIVSENKGSRIVRDDQGLPIISNRNAAELDCTLQQTALAVPASSLSGNQTLNVQYP